MDFRRLQGLAFGPWCVLALLAVLLAGCAPSATVAPPPVPPESVGAKATRLLGAGQFETAAALLAGAAGDAESPDARLYRQRAALLYADLGMEAATAVPGPAVSAPPDSRDVLLRSLSEAAAEVPDKALFDLNGLDTSALGDFERGLFLRTLGRLQAGAKDPAALVNLLNAELFPMPGKRRTELTHLVWESLRDSMAALDGKADPRNPHLAGWLALREDVRAYAGEPSALSKRLAEWRLQFPSHPANELLIDEIIELAEEQGAPVQRVALLLPLEGPLAAYAAAVRDGYLLARLARRDMGLDVKIYHAQGADAAPAYQRAAAEGAQLVVGPLDKPGVEALARLPARPVPVLALNNIAQPGVVAGLTQFGLAPEDEALDLARRAWEDGHRRVACIVPSTDLGERMLKTFDMAWNARGGTVVEQSRYGNSVPEYKNAIRRSFSLAQSEARAAALRRLLQRQLVFVPQARPDLDAIMLVAEPVAARQIIPQFRYLGVAHLPIYATAQVYGGAINPVADQDLDGVRFAGMPWVLGTADRDMRGVVESQWRRAGTTLQPFFAFGVDAYRLTRALPGLQGSPVRPLAGATGELSLDQGRRVHRALVWAEFRGGVPRMLESAP